MECRKGCGACCIYPSISSALPALPGGKPAMVPCPHLTTDRLCSLFGKPERPSVCSGFKATEWMCGKSEDDAIKNFNWLLCP
ncbi:MAG: hypothetical protein WCQ70_04085 [Lentimicrobiaceae bacterium]